MPKKILLSRSQINDEFVDKLKEVLLQTGSVIRDSALDDCISRDIVKDKIRNEDYASIKELLKECIDWADVVVVFIDKYIFNDTFVSILIELASQKGKRIVVVLAPDCEDEDIPMSVRNYANGGIISINESRLPEIIIENLEVWQKADGTTRNTPLTSSPKRK